jgi:hypothetical protein
MYTVVKKVGADQEEFQLKTRSRDRAYHLAEQLSNNTLTCI